MLRINGLRGIAVMQWCECIVRAGCGGNGRWDVLDTRADGGADRVADRKPEHEPDHKPNCEPIIVSHEKTDKVAKHVAVRVPQHDDCVFRGRVRSELHRGMRQRRRIMRGVGLLARVGRGTSRCCTLHERARRTACRRQPDARRRRTLLLDARRQQRVALWRRHDDG